jgi:hypothetical protein
MYNPEIMSECKLGESDETKSSESENSKIVGINNVNCIFLMLKV